MGFVVRKPDTIDLDVVLQIPGGSKSKITLTLKYLSVKERREMISAEFADDAEAFCELIVGWKGVHTEDGEDLPFNKTNFEKVLDIPYVREAIAGAVTNEFVSPFTPNIARGFFRKN